MPSLASPEHFEPDKAFGLGGLGGLLIRVKSDERRWAEKQNKAAKKKKQKEEKAGTFVQMDLESCS